MLEAQAEWTLSTPMGAVLFGGEQATYLTALAAMVPRAYFPTNETAGTTMTNAMGGSNGAYVGGIPLNSIGPYTNGKAVAPVGPGSGDYCTIPATVMTATTEWAMGVWASPNDVTSAARMYVWDGSVASQPEFWIATGGIPTLEIVDAGETTTLTGPAVLQNVWHWYVITCSSYRVCLYMDGALVAESTRTNAYTFPNSGTLYLGSDSAATSARLFNGYLSTPALWNTFLAPADNLRLWTIARDTPLGTKRMRDAPARDLPARYQIDSYPLADGGVIGDQYADPATYTFTGSIRSDADDVLQTAAQQFRGRVNSLMRGAGTIYWTPSGFVPLQAEVRRGERPDTSGGGARQKPLLMGLISADPRVYSQAIVPTVVPLTISPGVTSPFTSPLIMDAPGTSLATITNSGDAWTPPTLQIAGPFTRCTLQRTCTYDGATIIDALVIDQTLDDGLILTIDAALGRVYTGSTYSAASNEYDMLAEGSVLFEYAPGINYVSCTVADYGGATACKSKHRNAWMP